MASDNQITIVGNLTDDPELRYTANGAAVANFRVAYSHAHPRRGRQLDGRGDLVLHDQLLARPGGERRRDAHARHPRGGDRATEAALLGEPGGREAHRRRDRGRRPRSQSEVGHRHRHEDQPRSAASSSSGGDWGAAVAAPVGASSSEETPLDAG